jgi:hypothetical protein
LVKVESDVDPFKCQVMKPDLKMMDPVAVSLPAHMWVSFIAAYYAAPDESDHFTRHVVDAASRSVMDEEYIAARDDIAQKQLKAAEQQARNPFGIPGLGGDAYTSGAGSTAVDGNAGTGAYP